MRMIDLSKRMEEIEFAKRDAQKFIDSMLIPKKYMVTELTTATEVRSKLAQFERYPLMEVIRKDLEKIIDQAIEEMLATPIQFRFPKSKKRRIRKKWRKDMRNFKKLLDDSTVDIQIVGME